VIEMGSLQSYYSQCQRLFRQTGKRRGTITYGALATALGLRAPRQEWNMVRTRPFVVDAE
jgi:hypothetical protein